jgi:hypothetical protein
MADSNAAWEALMGFARQDVPRGVNTTRDVKKWEDEDYVKEHGFDLYSGKNASTGREERANRLWSEDYARFKQSQGLDPTITEEEWNTHHLQRDSDPTWGKYMTLAEQEEKAEQEAEAKAKADADAKARAETERNSFTRSGGGGGRTSGYDDRPTRNVTNTRSDPRTNPNPRPHSGMNKELDGPAPRTERRYQPEAVVARDERRPTTTASAQGRFYDTSAGPATRPNRFEANEAQVARDEGRGARPVAAQTPPPNLTPAQKRAWAAKQAKLAKSQAARAQATAPRTPPAAPARPVPAPTRRLADEGTVSRSENRPGALSPRQEAALREKEEKFARVQEQQNVRSRTESEAPPPRPAPRPSVTPDPKDTRPTPGSSPWDLLLNDGPGAPAPAPRNQDVPLPPEPRGKDPVGIGKAPKPWDAVDDTPLGTLVNPLTEEVGRAGDRAREAWQKFQRFTNQTGQDTADRYAEQNAGLPWYQREFVAPTREVFDEVYADEIAARKDISETSPFELFNPLNQPNNPLTSDPNLLALIGSPFQGFGELGASGLGALASMDPELLTPRGGSGMAFTMTTDPRKAEVFRARVAAGENPYDVANEMQGLGDMAAETILDPLNYLGVGLLDEAADLKNIPGAMRQGAETVGDIAKTAGRGGRALWDRVMSWGARPGPDALGDNLAQALTGRPPAPAPTAIEDILTAPAPATTPELPVRTPANLDGPDEVFAALTEQRNAASRNPAQAIEEFAYGESPYNGQPVVDYNNVQFLEGNYQRDYGIDALNRLKQRWNGEFSGGMTPDDWKFILQDELGVRQQARAQSVAAIPGQLKTRVQELVNRINGGEDDFEELAGAMKDVEDTTNGFWRVRFSYDEATDTLAPAFSPRATRPNAGNVMWRDPNTGQAVPVEVVGEGRKPGMVRVKMPNGSDQYVPQGQLSGDVKPPVKPPEPLEPGRKYTPEEALDMEGFFDEPGTGTAPRPVAAEAELPKPDPELPPRTTTATPEAPTTTTVDVDAELPPVKSEKPTPEKPSTNRVREGYIPRLITAVSAPIRNTIRVVGNVARPLGTTGGATGTALAGAGIIAALQTPTGRRLIEYGQDEEGEFIQGEIANMLRGQVTEWVDKNTGALSDERDEDAIQITRDRFIKETIGDTLMALGNIFVRPARATQQLAPIALLTLGEGVGLEANEDGRWLRAMLENQDLDEEELSALYFSLRNSYSGTIRDTYEEILSLDDPTREQMEEALWNHKDTGMDFLGEAVLDPLWAVDAFTNLKGNRAMQAWARRSGLQMSAPQRIVNFMRGGFIDDALQLIDRTIDPLRLPTTRKERDLRAIANQLEARLVGDTFDERVQSIADFLNSPRLAGMAGDQTPLVQGLNVNQLVRRIQEQAKKNRLATGRQMTPEDASRLANVVVRDIYSQVLDMRHGIEGFPTRAVGAVATAQKRLLSPMLLTFSPRYHIRNFINNYATATVDGYLNMDTPAQIATWWENYGGGALPSFFERGTDLFGQAVGRISPEVVAGMRLQQAAYLDYWARTWQHVVGRNVTQAVRASGVTHGQDLRELHVALSDIHDPRVLRTAFDTWAGDVVARNGLNAAQELALRANFDDVVLPLFEANRAGTFAAAGSIRDFSLLNYDDRFYWDNLLDIVSPYQFWTTRSAFTWTQRLVENPKAWATFFRMEEAFREGLNGHLTTQDTDEHLLESGRPTLPSSANPYLGAGIAQLFDSLLTWDPGIPGMAPVLDPERDDPRTTPVFADIVSLMIPVESIYDAWTDWGYQTRFDDGEDERIKNIIGLVNTLPGTSPLVDGALTLIDKAFFGGNQRLTQYHEPTFPLAGASLINPHLRRITEEWGLEPQDLDTWYRGAMQYEGEKPEWYDRDTVRQLAYMVAQREISPDEALRALVDETGATYQEAREYIKQAREATANVSFSPIAVGLSFQRQGDMKDVLKEFYGDREQAEKDAGLAPGGEWNDAMFAWYGDYMDAHPEVRILFHANDNRFTRKTEIQADILSRASRELREELGIPLKKADIEALSPEETQRLYDILIPARESRGGAEADEARADAESAEFAAESARKADYARSVGWELSDLEALSAEYIRQKETLGEDRKWEGFTDAEKELLYGFWGFESSGRSGTPNYKPENVAAADAVGADIAYIYDIQTAYFNNKDAGGNGRDAISTEDYNLLLDYWDAKNGRPVGSSRAGGGSSGVDPENKAAAEAVGADIFYIYDLQDAYFDNGKSWAGFSSGDKELLLDYWAVKNGRSTTNPGWVRDGTPGSVTQPTAPEDITEDDVNNAWELLN